MRTRQTLNKGFNERWGQGSGAKKQERTRVSQYTGVCAKCGAVREDRQLGLEDTPEEYVERLVAILREVRRVLRDDGTLWLNLGDSYAGSRCGGQGPGGVMADRAITKARALLAPAKRVEGIKPKDLVGIPWMVAFALRADGWFLRSDIIWAKGSCMPESVADRPTRAHEYLFLLSKSPSYFYDAHAIREKAVYPAGTRAAKGGSKRRGANGVNARPEEYAVYDGTRNKRTVWHVNPQPFKEAHFAVFPPKLIKPCIVAGTPEKGACSRCGAPLVRLVEKESAPSDVFTERSAPDDGFVYTGSVVEGKWRGQGQKLQEWINANPARTVGWEPGCGCEAEGRAKPSIVLDPFCGAGTTGLESRRLGRRFLGIELNPKYVEMARKRIVGDAPLFNA